MILTKEEIKELKKKIIIHEIDDTIIKEKGWINVKELYQKLNREVYEDLLLFKYGVSFLENIQNDKLIKFLSENKEVIDKAEDYIVEYRIGQKHREPFWAMFLNKDRKIIDNVLKTVFEGIMNEEEGELDEID